MISKRGEVRHKSQSCTLTVDVVKSGQQMFDFTIGPNNVTEKIVRNIFEGLDDLDYWIRAQTHFNQMHDKSVGARQDIFCPCSTDYLEKIRYNSCEIHQLVYQTTNDPKETPAPNEDVPKEQAGRGPTHLASGGLVFISFLMKYI